MNETDLLLAQLDSCVKSLKKAKVFSMDLETTGLNPREDRIIGVSFAVSEKDGWYFRVQRQSRSIPLHVLKERLKPALSDSEKTAVFHGGKFDLKFMWAASWDVNCRVADTMILAYCLDENRSGTGRLALKGRGSLTHELFGVILETWKESALSGGLFGKDEEQYGKDDALWTMACYKELTRQVNRRPKVKKVFWDMAMPLVRILAEMEYRGIRIDGDYLREYRKYLMQEIKEVEDRAIAMSNGKVMLTSPERISKYLFDDPEGLRLKPLPFMKRGKKGFYGTGEDILTRYVENDFVRDLLYFRKLTKIRGTYVDPFLKLVSSDPESRIHCSFHSTGTKTMRLSSSDPNLQNIPRPKKGEKYALRKAFVATPGNKLCVADYSQIELRLMAHRSQDKTMIEIYREDGDIHSRTQEALGLGGSEDNRVIAKACNFGLIYGLSPQGLQRMLWKNARLVKTVAECKKYSTRFFERYSAIPRYHLQIREMLRTRGYVTTIAGRKRNLAALVKKDFESAVRVGTNASIQGSAADIMNIAMRNFSRERRRMMMQDPRWEGVHMLLQVHDELVVEAPEEIAEQAAQRLKEVMEAVTNLLVPLIAKVGIGDNWAEAK